MGGNTGCRRIPSVLDLVLWKQQIVRSYCHIRSDIRGSRTPQKFGMDRSEAGKGIRTLALAQHRLPD